MSRQHKAAGRHAQPGRPKLRLVKLRLDKRGRTKMMMRGGTELAKGGGPHQAELSQAKPHCTEGEKPSLRGGRAMSGDMSQPCQGREAKQSKAKGGEPRRRRVNPADPTKESQWKRANREKPTDESQWRAKGWQSKPFLLWCAVVCCASCCCCLLHGGN